MSVCCFAFVLCAFEAAGAEIKLRQAHHPPDAFRLAQKPVKPFKPQLYKYLRRSFEIAGVNVKTAAETEQHFDAGQSVSVCGDPLFLQRCAQADKEYIRAGSVNYAQSLLVFFSLFGAVSVARADYFNIGVFFFKYFLH